MCLSPEQQYGEMTKSVDQHEATEDETVISVLGQQAACQINGLKEIKYDSIYNFVAIFPQREVFSNQEKNPMTFISLHF